MNPEKNEKRKLIEKAEHLGLQGFYKKNTTCAAITKNYFHFYAAKVWRLFL